MIKKMLIVIVLSVLSVNAYQPNRAVAEMDIRHLNTKFDYEYVRQHFPEKIWRAKWQSLLDERMQWLNTGKLATKADGVTVKDIKRIVTNKKGDNTEEHYQYEYKEDPNCKMKRLGFTVEEIQAALNS